MNTTTLKMARDLWLYNGIVAHGYHLNDGEIEVDAITLTENDLFMQYAPLFNFEVGRKQIVAKINSLGHLAKVGKDAYIVL